MNTKSIVILLDYQIKDDNEIRRFIVQVLRNTYLNQDSISNIKLNINICLIGLNYITNIIWITECLCKYYTIISTTISDMGLLLNVNANVLLPQLYGQSEEVGNCKLMINRIINGHLIYGQLISIYSSSSIDSLNEMIDYHYQHHSIPKIILISTNQDKDDESMDDGDTTPPSTPPTTYTPFTFSTTSLLSSSSSSSSTANITEQLKQYGVVYTGGHFDHLHSGHRYFLSIGALISQTKFLIAMLEPSQINSPCSSPSKQLNTYSQSLDERVGAVHNFLALFTPLHRCIEIIRNERCSNINFCPMTFQLPSTSPINNDALLVAMTVLSSATKINEIRITRNLAPFVLHAVQEIHCNTSHGKLSSTTIRRMLSGEISSSSPPIKLNLDI